MPHPKPTHEPDACPDQDTLVAFHTGRLSEPESERLAEHLGRCGTCLSSLRELSGDTGRDSFQEKLLRHCGDRGAFASTADPGYRVFEAVALQPHESRTWPGGARAGRAPREDAEFDTSERYGEYAVQGLIDGGGMGIVYRAVHRGLKRPVALKTLRPGVLVRPEALARFRNEGAATARLDHPNVVRVYDSGEDGGRPYLAMELVEGETLEAKLAHGPLACTEAATLVRTLAGAVAHAHEKNILHRDLKPSNVLVARDGTLKLADFGLAHIVDDAVRLTVSDAVMGTPAYMAPEQAAGRARDVSVRTDVYALGVILYQALTGTPPFISSDKHLLLRLVRQGGITPPSKCRSDVPADLETICLKCLEHSQKDRYSSATSLCQDLDRWIAGQKPVGTLPGRTKRAWRLVQHHAVALSCGLAALVVLTAGVVALARKGPEAIPDGESATVLRSLTSDLDAAKPVTLVGEKGWPKWFKWRFGGDAQLMNIARDGTFSADMTVTKQFGLLELLADPRHDRFKLTAEVRHDQGNYNGFVGLYVGHRVYPRQPDEVHVLASVLLNSVTAGTNFVGPKGLVNTPGQTAHRMLRINADTFQTPLPQFAADLALVQGKPMMALGARNGVWHKIEVTVGPDEIVADVAGDSIRVGKQDLSPQRFHDRCAWIRKTFADEPFAQTFRPEFAPRGGVGLMLYPTAAASIRNVVLTPLKVAP